MHDRSLPRAGELGRVRRDISIMSKVILSILEYTREDAGNPSRLCV